MQIIQIVGETCRDPLGFGATVDQSYENYPAQRYYLRGLSSGNYNCDRYLIQRGQNDPLTATSIGLERLSDFRKAYNCCKERSREFICLDNDWGVGFEADLESSVDAVVLGDVSEIGLESGKVFCKANSKCTIKGITFQSYFRDNDRLICSESYSLCPYNFTIRGGTEYCDYYKDGIWEEDNGRWKMISEENLRTGNCMANSEIRNEDCTFNEKAGRCKNYCQYLSHCTVAGGADYQFNSSLDSPYFADACINFIGDSQNRVSYGGGFLGSQRHFSAPIAQCMKETLENLFYNKVGHSKCLNVNEFPSADGTCPSNQYISDGDFIHKKGNDVGTKSFFSLLQEKMQLVVKMVMTLAIMFYGASVLTGKSDIRNKKDVLMLFVKIGLVLYFAVGTAWQDQFFKGVYGSSHEFAKMVFKIEVGKDEKKRDGCQFGDVYLSDGTAVSTNSSYPEGKEYLAIWDTLDCKIARYLGFGPDHTVMNIANLILAGMFTGAIGIYFSLLVMFFGFFFLALTIRALHIFLSSAIAIILMVFVSPIVIPTVLFAKTSNIFKSWLTNLISFVLQPMILFAYIAILIIMVDRTMIGSATFTGDGPSKTINCEEICEDLDGNLIFDDTGATPECNLANQIKVNPEKDSVACLVNVNDFGKFAGFEIIGIGIPIIKDILDNPRDVILTILKGVLIMYLLYKFMDEIPGIATALIGGAMLPSSKASATSMFAKTARFLKGAQKRASRGTQKAAKKAGRATMEEIRKRGSDGKSIAQGKSKADGGNRTGDSIGKGSSNTGDSTGKGSSNTGDSSSNVGPEATTSDSTGDGSSNTGSSSNGPDNTRNG